MEAMREQWRVIDVTRPDDSDVIAECDTEAEALEHMQVPADLMGTVVRTIQKVWTNARPKIRKPKPGENPPGKVVVEVDGKIIGRQG